MLLTTPGTLRHHLDIQSNYLYPNHCHLILLLHPSSAWLLDLKGTNVSNGKTQGVLLNPGKRLLMFCVHFGHPTSAAVLVWPFKALFLPPAETGGDKAEALCHFKQSCEGFHNSCARMTLCKLPCSSSAWVPEVTMLHTYSISVNNER